MEQPAVKLAVICSGMGDRDVNTFSQSAPTDKACYVYRLLNAKDVVVVMCNTAVSPEQSFSWTNEVGILHSCADRPRIGRCKTHAKFKF